VIQDPRAEGETSSGDPAASLNELADLLAGHSFADTSDDSIEFPRRYLNTFADGGWLVARWPRRWGGRDADAATDRRIKSLLRGHPGPDLYPFFVGLNMVGPTLLAYGDDAQRDRWLPAIARGDDLWCQMFSEPGAGSDLANVATRAVRTDDGWLLQGQKVWTSRGAYANWGLCLARTDPEVPKHDGLTMFAVPMGSPGVTVRPLVQMNGDDHFSEVFIDDVVIPEQNRIGEVGQGWTIALSVLAFERSSIGVARRGPGTARADRADAAPGWLRAMSDAGLLSDPVRRDGAIAAFVEDQVTTLSAARSSARARATGQPGLEGSGQKVRLSDSRKRRAYLMLQLLGADGMLDGQRIHHDALTAPSHSLRGGTDEIQRNIVSERVLGLPPEPRADRGVPWSISRRGVS
jgi:alkylation response protein AidB-like acyl-CoA dehydrogenase